MKMSKTHLIIGDSHVTPDSNLDRFSWLPSLIIDTQPDVVINIGDFFDMPSLCSYDMGTGSFEGRRLSKDLEAGQTAIDRIMTPLKKRKKKLPRFVSLEGNHEYRLTKAVERNHTLLYDVVDNSAFGWKDFGWEYYPYNGGTPDTVEIDGIFYRHFMPTAASSNAMSGVNLANSLVSSAHKSIVVGHSHQLDIHRRVAIDGTPLWGIVSGCFIDPSDGAFQYAGLSVQNWWSGVVLLNGVSDGSFEDLELINFKTIKREYS